jgi:uncharacterized protein (TIGR03083 family)
MTATLPARSAARAPALDRRTATRLAAEQYDRLCAVLRDLGPEDWERPTDCPGWDVRTMTGHLLGALEMASSLGRMLQQVRAAARAGGGIDALTAVQVAQHAALSPAEVVERAAVLAPRAVRGRRRKAALLGRFPVPEPQLVGGTPERWTVGYLLDVILTRDAFMHRVDISRAVGRGLELTADSEGVLVADVVAEWAQRHGRPYRLTLTGPAGGSWSSGADGQVIELDAVEFCRIQSGRGSGAGLLGRLTGW